jgi:hypothetical protein
MSTYFSLAAPAQSSGDGLTIGEIVSSIPVDPASLFTLLLLVGCVGAVLWFGSRSNDKGGGTA